MTGPLAPVTSVADLDRRFYAFALDRSIAWGIDAAAAVVLVQVLVQRDHLWAGLAAILAVVVVVGAVFAVVLGLTGTSPGMAVGSLRVVREGSGAPMGVRAALLRQLILGVAALPTLGLGLATLAWTAVMDPDGRRRGWHDHVAHSVVVDVRPIPEEAPEPDEVPRHVVNLTALRLVPAPAPAPAATPVAVPARAGRPAAPPPIGPPGLPTPRHAAVASPAEPLVTAPPPPARQQLGYPLVPEPRPDAAPDAAVRVGAHAARPEPGRWRVSFDTGESFVVTGLALVGRRPEARPGEQVQHLVGLDSGDLSLSKTHAQLSVASDGALVVMDRGSTNGSFLVRQGVPRGLSAGRAATLLDGDHVRFGDREMTVAREP